MYTFGYLLNSFEHSLKLLLLLTLLLFNNFCFTTRDFSPSGRFQSFLLIFNNILTFNCLSCWSLQDFFLLIHSFLNNPFFIGVIYYQLPFSDFLLLNNLNIFSIFIRLLILLISSLLLI